MDVSFNRASKKSHGFTFIEIVVTLAISSIILSYAVPQLQTLVKLNESAVTINILVSDFAYARTEALKRMEDVVVCKSSDGLTCTKGTGWQNGWIIFVDDVDRNMQHGSDESLLKVQQALGNHIKITFSTFNNKNKIVYRPSGVANYSNGTFQFCINNERYHKDLVLSRTGSTSLKINPGVIFDNKKSC